MVRVKVDESWKEPCLWAWSAPDGKNVFEAWPGEALVLKESGWYEAKVPVWVNSIIVNADDGAGADGGYIDRSCGYLGECR